MKLILLFAFSWVLIANTSCNNNKSFTEILKDSLTISSPQDSQRVNAYIKLLQEKYCLQDSTVPSPPKILSRQSLTNKEIDDFRIKSGDVKHLMIENDNDSKFAKVKVSVGDLKAVMNKSTDDDDLIIFNLSIIHTQDDVNIYNKNFGTAEVLKGYKGIQYRPLLMMHLRMKGIPDDTDTTTINTLTGSASYYLAGKLCPPPRTCN